MSNRLANESSPYLLQHKDNPVEWYPWDEEALEKAKAEDKPIFLSIGYSACHWCHVMAHESFEDQDTAATMNDHFINIKVDREERPDLDRIYMNAVQAMTGSGGWPMSVFLTPDGIPFYGGTYFPPTPRHGMPSFSQVLLGVADAWNNRRQELIAGGERVLAAIERQNAVGIAASDENLRPTELQSAVNNLRQSFDGEKGGWGGAPKFPQPMALEFLLRHHHTTDDEKAMAMVTQTLAAMARGGMYDQLGGGFHRYSVDDHWLVPHFEKMLYDNAQLARVYLHAWQLTSEVFFRTITEEILDYVIREMNDPAGGFYSTQDADSEGQEGKFFVWTSNEIQEVLGDKAKEFMATYGITERGNFEGKNILEFVGDMAQRPAMAGARHKLFEAREERVHPGRDEKVLTSWNGLMMAAFAEAARTLERSDYREVAERNADFLLKRLKRDDGRLLHTWKDGTAKQNGFLEDYSYLIEGLLELYQTTFEPRWFVAAQELAEMMLAHFAAPSGGFFDTSDDHETLVTRPRDLQDNATPSGNAMAATALLKLGALSTDMRYVDTAREMLGQVQPMATRYPLGFGQWLQAMAFALAESREIAIVGQSDAADTHALLAVVQEKYRPFQVVAVGAPDSEPTTIPLLRDRGKIDGRAAAYVCTNFACQAPITEPSLLKVQLSSPMG